MGLSFLRKQESSANLFREPTANKGFEGWFAGMATS